VKTGGMRILDQKGGAKKKKVKNHCFTVPSIKA